MSIPKRNLFLYVICDKYFVALLLIFIGLAIIGIMGSLFTRDPLRIVGDRLQPPSNRFILGTDALGRDVFAQIVHGIKNSLLIGVVAGLIVIAIAS
ncbi:MAG: hypothetical protein QXN17_07185, partial [Nitrososphaerota archaeon]